MRNDRSLHGRDTVCDQRRLCHQTCAEAAFLHALRRATDIEINLGIAEIRADPGAARKRAGIAATELERNRLLGRIETDQPLAIAVQPRIARSNAKLARRKLL